MVKQLNLIEESFLKGLLHGLSFRKSQTIFSGKIDFIDGTMTGEVYKSILEHNLYESAFVECGLPAHCVSTR